MFFVLRAMGELLLSNLNYKSFVDFAADLLGPAAGFFVGWSYWFAWIVTWGSEKIAKARGAVDAPNFNFTRFKFLGMNLDFSIDKAKRELGYEPRVSFDDAMSETMAWYRAEQK